MKKKNKFFKLKKNNEIPTNNVKISVERTHSVPCIEINGQRIVGIQSFKIDYHLNVNGKIEEHLILDIGRISSLKIISNYWWNNINSYLF